MRTHWHVRTLFLFSKLPVFSPLLSPSKYIVSVRRIALQFVASVSKRKSSAHFIAAAGMVVRSTSSGALAAPFGTFSLERKTTAPSETGHNQKRC